MSAWEPNRPPQMPTWELEHEWEQPEEPLVPGWQGLAPWSAKLEAPSMKRQLKCRQNRDSKLAKKFVSLDAEISNLKSQMEALEDKITKASKSANARFKRKKIRSMKKEADKINEKLRESEKELKLVEPRVPKDLISRSQSRGFAPALLKLHPPNRNKCIEAKIADLNKKIRRAKKNKIRSALITKRDKLKEESNWGPMQLQEAFNSTYRSYRISGLNGVDPETFLNKIRGMSVDLIKCETSREAVRTQDTTWIRFSKGQERVDLAFNSRMLAAYGLSDIAELIDRMITHMIEQIKKPELRDSGFVFEEVIETNIDFHRLNLTRGSSYLPLPDWLSRKKAIINPKNSDMECFKWAVIAADRWEEIDKHPERISKLRKFEGE